MAALSAHPFLFALLFIVGAAQLGLIAYNLFLFENDGYPSNAYKERFRYLLFCSAWTVILALVHYFMAAFIGAFLTFITWVLWLVGAILFHLVKYRGPCDGSTRCILLKVIDTLDWIAFGIALLAFLAIGYHVHGSRGRRTYRDGLYA